MFYNHKLIIFSIFAFLVSHSNLSAKEESKDVNLSFEIKDKSGWTPAIVRVKKGSGINLTLKNSSNAPACFEIKDTEKDKFIKKPLCVEAGKQEKVLFFVNHPKGSYKIMNRYEHQKAGTFIIE